MTSNQEILINNLKEKIKRFISLYEKLKDENSSLAKENSELINKNIEKDNIIKELEEKYETLKIAKTVAGSTDSSHDAKIKVNRIVREIDKCIALLNR